MKAIYRKTSAVHYLAHHYINRIIGLQLANHRLQRGWTQNELAVQLEIHPMKISGWETGNLGISRVHLDQVLDIYETDLKSFLGDAQLPPLYEMINLGNNSS